MRKMKKAKQAVSDILGTILLLGITVSIFSVLSAVVLTYPFEPSNPSINLIGYVDGNEIIIEHCGGEKIRLDTKIILTINDSMVFMSTAEENLTATSSNGDNYWNLGEIVLINTTKAPINEIILNAKVDVTVVDITSNSVVLMGIFQEAN